MTFGCVYRIYHKDIPSKCYIGKTELTIQKRFQAHIREAKRASVGDAKLHIVMKALKPETFKIERLATAKNIIELSKLENFYIKKFDSVKSGWNKVAGANTTQARGKPMRFKTNGLTYKGRSLAGLCRELEISNSTVNYWRKKGKTLNFSINQALSAKKITTKKELIIVYRKEFKDVNELARSKDNKHKVSPSTIRQRVRKGMTYEEALAKQIKPKEIKIKFNKKTLVFKSIYSAHGALSKKIKDIPTYSTVVASLSKGESPEAAFGIGKPKWLKELNIENYIKKGYLLTGELNAQSKPVIDKKNKEIFSSIKVFSKTYGFDYTTIAAEIKSGLSPEEIIKKRDK